MEITDLKGNVARNQAFRAISAAQPGGVLFGSQALKANLVALGWAEKRGAKHYLTDAGLQVAIERNAFLAATRENRELTWADWQEQQAAERAKNTQPSELGDAPEMSYDPATITRLDAVTQTFEGTDKVIEVVTLGIAPDGTPVVVVEDTFDPDTGEWLLDVEPTPSCIWGYPTIEAARQDRGIQVQQEVNARAQVSIEQARKVLGDLAKDAKRHGVITVLTFHGEPIAQISPYAPEPATTTSASE